MKLFGYVKKGAGATGAAPVYVTAGDTCGCGEYQPRPTTFLSIVGFKDRAHNSACPKPQAMKDETPHCHRVQAAVKLTQPDVPQQEGKGQNGGV